MCGSGKICIRGRDGLPYSRFTSRALLSSRSATNFECRRWLSPVHSRNSNCPTSTGFSPAARRHFCFRQPGSPPAVLRLRQVREWALLRFRRAELLHQLRPYHWRERRQSSEDVRIPLREVVVVPRPEVKVTACLEGDGTVAVHLQFVLPALAPDRAATKHQRRPILERGQVRTSTTPVRTPSTRPTTSS